MDSSKNKKQAHGPLSSTQVCELERCFTVRKYITGHEREHQLVSKLHFTETQVTVVQEQAPQEKEAATKRCHKKRQPFLLTQIYI